MNRQWDLSPQVEPRRGYQAKIPWLSAPTQWLNETLLSRHVRAGLGYALTTIAAIFTGLVSGGWVMTRLLV